MGQDMQRSRKTSRVSDEIDKNLKRAFDDVANEALPSRFSELLDQLRSQDDAPTEQAEKPDDA